ncbi:DUF6596 domain-containing protein [Nonomuraea sp. NPDC001636]|uniref:RNA polymerase sigma factor n=1 Tax=Nonomuraea sp. NPDC001636 TaxID=3154391 RepID=UPI00331740BE
MYDDPPEPLGAIDDDRLRLIFTCCHPAPAMQTRVALTVRMVGGLTVPEIARAHLMAETAMERRITRAKAKIKAARIPCRVPAVEDLRARVSGVLAVLYLVFNEGYLATGPDTDRLRLDLTAEAIRLARLIRALMPGDGEVAGLPALMLLTDARRTARISAGGELVPLEEQDRRARRDPSPFIALDRAIAVAELDGPQVALAAVDHLEDALAGHHAYHATRADLLRRLGHSGQSRAAYDRAVELAGNTAETAYLTRGRDQLR